MENLKPSAMLVVRIDLDQRRALERLADERDVPISSLVRDAMTSVTGVPDGLRRQRKRQSSRIGEQRLALADDDQADARAATARRRARANNGDT